MRHGKRSLVVHGSDIGCMLLAFQLSCLANTIDSTCVDGDDDHEDDDDGLQGRCFDSIV